MSKNALVKVEVPGRIELNWTGTELLAVGDQSLKVALEQLVSGFGRDPLKWPKDRNSLLTAIGENPWILTLVRFTRMVRDEWKLPYNHDELCHCRMVPTEKVLRVIEQGCLDPIAIARTTLAGTGCGTCRPESEKLIQSYS